MIDGSCICPFLALMFKSSSAFPHGTGRPFSVAFRGIEGNGHPFLTSDNIFQNFISTYGICLDMFVDTFY